MQSEIDPRKKVSMFTYSSAEDWANNHPFNANPTQQQFNTALFTWMEGEGYFFNNDADASKVWNLFLMRLTDTRKRIVSSNLTKIHQKDQYLFKVQTKKPQSRKRKS